MLYSKLQIKFIYRVCKEANSTKITMRLFKVRVALFKKKKKRRFCLLVRQEANFSKSQLANCPGEDAQLTFGICFIRRGKVSMRLLVGKNVVFFFNVKINFNITYVNIYA